MKMIGMIFWILTIFTSFNVFSFDMSRLTGGYVVTSEGEEPFVSMTITYDGKLTIINQFMDDISESNELSYCHGMIVLQDDILITDLICNNGEYLEEDQFKYQLKLDFRGVDSYRQFNISVYTSYDDRSRNVNFEAI